MAACDRYTYLIVLLSCPLYGKAQPDRPSCQPSGRCYANHICTIFPCQLPAFSYLLLACWRAVDDDIFAE